uniref:Putative glycosyltransferase n=1 Tax=viral metagenome TaxID=1070528 RepID=A0A6M3IIG1_9ZZZZ
MDITAYISTRNRYFSTLPQAIISLCQQTLKPKEFILYDDGEHKDLRNHPLYQYIFGLLDECKINWKVGFSDGKGQVANHQRVLSEAKYPFIFRCDDDNILQPTVLEKLASHFIDPKVGAVGGCVLHPNKPILNLPNFYVYNDIEYCQDPSMWNAQWFRSNGVHEIGHLYSTFLFRKEASKHGYNMDLSPVGDKEESLFTAEMKHNGWKLLLDSSAITYHFRYSEGGIRDSKIHTPENFQHDTQIFLNKLTEWGIKLKFNKIIVLDCGLGDHLVFKKILPEIKEKYKDKRIIVACCYPLVFEDDKDIILTSLAEVGITTNIEEYNIYKKMELWKWRDSLENAFKKLYGV